MIPSGRRPAGGQEARRSVSVRSSSVRSLRLLGGQIEGDERGLGLAGGGDTRLVRP